MCRHRARWFGTSYSAEVLHREDSEHSFLLLSFLGIWIIKVHVPILKFLPLWVWTEWKCELKFHLFRYYENLFLFPVSNSFWFSKGFMIQIAERRLWWISWESFQNLHWWLGNSAMLDHGLLQKYGKCWLHLVHVIILSNAMFQPIK